MLEGREFFEGGTIARWNEAMPWTTQSSLRMGIIFFVATGEVLVLVALVLLILVKTIRLRSTDGNDDDVGDVMVAVVQFDRFWIQRFVIIPSFLILYIFNS